MQEEVQLMDPGAEFFTPEGGFINELSNIPGDPEAVIACARFPSGKATR